jgi:hypothetical protein
MYLPASFGTHPHRTHLRVIVAEKALESLSNNFHKTSDRILLFIPTP